MHKLPLVSSSPSPAAFSARNARLLCRDLLVPRARTFWIDLSLSLAVGYSAFYIAHVSSIASMRVAAFVVSTFALYRAVVFFHEFSHIRADRLRGVRVFWNVFCGIPLLAPTFFSWPHMDHHRIAKYGTDGDPEYLPLARGSLLGLCLFVGVSAVLPVFLVVRFLVLAPLGYVSSRVREFVRRRASTNEMNVRYDRALPQGDELRIWRLQELACVLYATTLVGLTATGHLHFSWLVQGYATVVSMFVVNKVRVLVAHRYRHGGPTELSVLDQLVDSINFPRWPIVTALWAPVGLRYHGLHHFMPNIPYHALPTAHARLMRELPEESPYRLTVSEGLWSSLRDLVREVRTSRRTDVRRAPEAA